MAACPQFDGMLQNMWDARILTGGVSTQRGPMSTAPDVINPSGPFHPTPDALCSCLPSLGALSPRKQRQRQGNSPRKEHSEFACPLALAPPPPLCTNTVLCCHSGWRRQGQKFSCNGNINQQEYKVLRARSPTSKSAAIL